MCFLWLCSSVTVYLYIKIYTMRYKAVTLNKVEELEATITRVELEINRNQSRDSVLNALAKSKEKLEELRSLINIEHDNFEEQFKSY